LLQSEAIEAAASTTAQLTQLEAELETVRFGKMTVCRVRAL
jgi:hypothetical protein